MSDLQVIIGLGATGFSCLRYLHKQGAKLLVLDTRSDPPYLNQVQQGFPEIKVILGKFDDALLNQAARIILSPGITQHSTPIASQKKRGVPVIGDIELFAEQVQAPVIGLTGTNAKSTVTTLVGLMMQQAGFQVSVGGNLGTPVLDMLSQDDAPNLYVLELSSFQLETTYSLKPKVASILNITPDHMDRYANFEAYKQAKHRIYLHCQRAVCNRDDIHTDVSHFKNKIYFTLDQPKPNEFGLIQKNKETFLAFYDQALLSTEELLMKGTHDQANALASLAVAHQMGVPLKAMLPVLKTFKGLPHRCQYVAFSQGITWYNDSKGTNVGATQAAIIGLGQAMEGKIILIAGGMGKNADFRPLMKPIQNYVRHAILFGEAAKEMKAVLEKSVPITMARDLEQAVEIAEKKAKSKDSVLLSPACASFDMFHNFEHRGDVFMAIVKKFVTSSG